MFDRLRQSLAAHGPATTVAVVALVVALCGGAYAAAKGGLTSKQKKQVKALVQKEIEKNPGPPGPAGAKGDAGGQGPQGAQGPKGDKGENGTNGTNGKSAVVDEVTPGAFGCDELGGANVRLEGQEPEEGVEVCNGKPGEPGEPGAEGSPWTAGGTLPPGATEVATWSFQDVAGQTELGGDPIGIWAPVSFSVPLNEDTASGSNTHIHYVPLAGENSGTGPCPSEFLEPEAAPGEVCIYESSIGALINTSFVGLRKVPLGGEGLGTAGGYLEFSSNTDPSEVALGAGSIAVTGCSASLPASDPNKCPS
jgi:Collagen triple helix repeat (20 copies)